jgi:hypothetical protein
MDRRGFLTAFFGAAAGLALTSGSAAALTLAAPAMPTPKTPPEDALLREHDENEARIEKALRFVNERIGENTRGLDPSTQQQARSKKQTNRRNEKKRKEK